MNSPDDAIALARETRAPAAPADAGALTQAEKALLEEIGRRTRAPLIIERPEGLLSARKLTNYLLTFLWWSVWGHFMLPLVTLFLWMSGFRRFSEELLGHGGLDALVSRLPLYGAVVGMLCGALIGWALLNWWRFADRERRRSSHPVPTAEIAHRYGLAPEELERWQSLHRVVVRHDVNGHPTGLEPPGEAAGSPRSSANAPRHVK